MKVLPLANTPTETYQGREGQRRKDGYFIA